ncbi:extensin [Ceratitis capitata]|uniref:extensin n=1 Tax=Ceratitis capitata TaxID=7213 RepID=UPI00061880D3|nr:extensin [Ceratitis capitata]
MPRFLFTLLFGATILVAICMVAQAQPDPTVAGSRPTRRPTPPTRRPSWPTRRPTPPTRRPDLPTRRPTPPTRRPSWPTRRPIPPTRRPLPTSRPTTPSPLERPARSVTTVRPCPRLPEKCSSAGPSLCVRSRNGKLCRRVANQCALRNLNCQSKPRNNWSVSKLKGCCKLKVGQRPVKCKDL